MVERARTTTRSLRGVRGSDVGPVLAGEPKSSVATPASVAALAGGRTTRAVWLNELGGVTFEVGSGADHCFVKWMPAGTGFDLEAEAARLRWARRYWVVPEVIDIGVDDDGSWLITKAIP